MSFTKRQKGIKYAKIPKKNKILFLKKVIEDKSSLKSVNFELFRLPNFLKSIIQLPRHFLDNFDKIIKGYSLLIVLILKQLLI